MADMLWKIYYGRYITADTLQQAFHGRCRLCIWIILFSFVLVVPLCSMIILIA